ncbi:MAG: taurine ABC transporter substrate-binding protein [Salinisphaera sp.]|jgi:taurine transport system substrate-binding protein|nr:taurine ABC transporter substrate-binding protein [Salinisphaera sp.]
MKSTKIFSTITGIAALASLAVFSFANCQAAETITIGTYNDPVPMQAAAHEGKFSKATGWKVDWRKFDSGSEAIAALASGDLKITELGSTPLAIAASQGVNLEVFMVDYVIGKSESLIVRNGSGIKKISDLKGKKVAVPFGSTSDFSLRGTLKHANIDPRDLTILNMQPDQIVAAWKQGYIDAAFVWPPAQSEILKTGKRLVGADQVADWGYPTFNVLVVNKQFAESHKKELVAFIKELGKVNHEYLADPSSWTPENPVVKAVAAQTGATPAQVPEVIGGYKFLPLKTQLKDAWLGGGIAKAMKSTAKLLKSEGLIYSVSDDYSKFVTTEYVKAAVSQAQ